MITLTTPASVPGELGASSANSYAKLRVMNILADPVTQSITAQVQLLDTSNPNLPIITGALGINTQGNSPEVTISVPALDIQSVLPLTVGAQTTVQAWITALQNNIEAGLVSLGLIAGTQSTGV